MGVVVVMVVAAVAVVIGDVDPGVLPLLLLIFVVKDKPDICSRNSSAMGLAGRRLPPPLLLLLLFLLGRRPRRRWRRFFGTLLVPVPEDDKDLLELVDIMDLLELDVIIIIMLRADDCVVNRNKWGAAGILLLVPQLLAVLSLLLLLVSKLVLTLVLTLVLRLV
jgi:hypothetical protein